MQLCHLNYYLYLLFFFCDFNYIYPVPHHFNLLCALMYILCVFISLSLHIISYADFFVPSRPNLEIFQTLWKVFFPPSDSKSLHIILFFEVGLFSKRLFLVPVSISIYSPCVCCVCVCTVTVRFPKM